MSMLIVYYTLIVGVSDGEFQIAPGDVRLCVRFVVSCTLAEVWQVCFSKGATLLAFI